MRNLQEDPKEIERLLDMAVGRHRPSASEHWIGAVIVWLMFGLGAPIAATGSALRFSYSSAIRGAIIAACCAYSAVWLVAIVIGARQELVVTPREVSRRGPFGWSIARADIALVRVRRSARRRRPAFLVFESPAGKRYEYHVTKSLRELASRIDTSALTSTDGRRG